MREVSMFQLQELVRLHRMGSECREVARLLGISPNTERKYRLALLAAGVLSGSPGELPSEAELLVAIEGQLGSGDRTPQLSTVAPWLCRIEEWSDSGAGPQAIFDRLCRDHEDFTGSLSAVKRACSAFRRKRGVSPEDVAIPVVTEPGHIAQVDFGYVGKLFDPATMVMRKAWVFVMTLGHSPDKQVLALARDLPKVWNAATTTMVERKNLVRMLIREVTISPIEIPQRATRTQILWVTGAVSDIQVDRPGPASVMRTPDKSVAAIRELYLKKSH